MIKNQPDELKGRKLNEPEPWRAFLLMLLVAGYLVTTQPSFFSSPPLQPIPFVILSSCLSITSSFVFIPLILNGKLFSLLCTLFFSDMFFSTLLLNALLSFFSHFLPRHPSLPFIPCSVPLFCIASGQHQGVFSPLLSNPSISPSLLAILSFSCGWPGRHAPRLYRCLSERRRPSARD